MPNVIANGIEIEYDTFGDLSSPPLLLIAGTRAQLISWPDPLCDQLAKQGLYVIRYDNRDVGLSSKIDYAAAPNMLEVLASRERGEDAKIPYTLDDMAEDAIGLLDALNFEKAHVFGISIGGMIGQIMAIRYPSRVSTLISMMCGTAGASIGAVKPEVASIGMIPPPEDRDGYVEHNVRFFHVLAGSKIPLDDQLTRQVAQQSYDRCYYPEGWARQQIAVLTAWDRTQALKSVTVPTLVILGSEDPVIPVEDGRAVAEAVPGAELLIIEGLGHGLQFPEVWPIWVDAVAAHTRKAGS